MAITEHLLEKKTKVCGIRSNKGLPKSFVETGNKLKAVECVFCRKGEILLQTWKIKNGQHITSGKCEKTREWECYSCKEALLLTSVQQIYDRADCTYHTIQSSEKTVKWSKKVFYFYFRATLGVKEVLQS